MSVTMQKASKHNTRTTTHVTSVISKLYNSVSLPQMTYGLELLSMPSFDRKLLETVHISAAKRTQRLPIQTATPAPLKTLGWMTMEGILALRRIKSTVIQRYLEASSSKHELDHPSPIYLMYTCSTAVFCGLHDFNKIHGVHGITIAGHSVNFQTKPLFVCLARLSGDGKCVMVSV